MPIFHRRKPSPAVDGPQWLRALVREDFECCCAYCLLPELLAGGVNAFEIDHFKPKSKPEFSHLIDDFYNLYYSCHVCNHSKGASWPDAELVKSGHGFVDFCADQFSDHFNEGADGYWKPLTNKAQYTLDKLRLNNPHLAEIRRLLKRVFELKAMTSLNWDVPCSSQITPLLQLLR